MNDEGFAYLLLALLNLELCKMLLLYSVAF